MTRKSFRLEPHPSSGPVEDVEISGWIERRVHELAFHLQLAAPSGEVLLPSLSDTPNRRHGLWEETCFELFLAPKDSPRYWEFNFSPSGNWNVYRFFGYRLGMQEEETFSSLPFTFGEDAGSLSLSADLILDGLLPRGQDLEAGVSAVLRHKQGKMTYWALAHSSPKPDFHRREGFVVELWR